MTPHLFPSPIALPSFLAKLLKRKAYIQSSCLHFPFSLFGIHPSSAFAPTVPLLSRFRWLRHISLSIGLGLGDHSLLLTWLLVQHLSFYMSRESPFLLLSSCLLKSLQLFCFLTPFVTYFQTLCLRPLEAIYSFARAVITKHHKLDDLKQRFILLHHILEARNPKSRCQQGCPLSKGWGRILSRLFLASGGCWQVSAFLAL